MCENSWNDKDFTYPQCCMASLSATLTYDTLRFGEFEDFPETSEPVWILGKEYNALTGKKEKLYILLT